MNIRVDLNTPIKDGTEVVFRSPVDCSQITGLIVYYKEDGITASKEFAFADAHGTNVGDIDHLFAENVVVKVILDLSTNMAFVQNADTNAYLEGRFADVTPDDSKVSDHAWSSKNTVDKLCPAFEESGTLVQCEPVEGYPLAVATEFAAAQEGSGDPSPDNVRPITVYPAITLQCCGKNLYDAETYPMTPKTILRHATGKTGESAVYSATMDYIPAVHLRGLAISIRNAPATTNGSSTGAGIAFYDADKVYISGTNKAQATVPDNACFMRFSIATDYVEEAQIELGGAVTAHELYRGHSYAIASPESVACGSYDWHTGQLTVTHKAVDMSTLDWQHNEDNAFLYAELPEGKIPDATVANDTLCNVFAWAPGTFDPTFGIGADTYDISDEVGVCCVAVPDMYEGGDTIDLLTDAQAVLVYPLAEPYTVLYDPRQVTAQAGTNTLYSDIGTIKVSGRVDPATIIEKLTSAIIALGGNI